MNTNKIEVIGEILLPKSDIHLPIGLGVANNTLALAAGTMRLINRWGRATIHLLGTTWLTVMFYLVPFISRLKWVIEFI